MAAFAGLFVPAGAATPPQPTPIDPVKLPSSAIATAAAEPATAGAQDVRLTITLRTELQCGRPRGASVIVVLPQAMTVPTALAHAHVLVGGHSPKRVAVSDHVVSIALAPTSGVTCFVLAPGRITVEFEPAAGLGNPHAPGRYRVSIRNGGASGVAQLTVS